MVGSSVVWVSSVGTRAVQAPTASLECIYVFSIMGSCPVFYDLSWVLLNYLVLIFVGRVKFQLFSARGSSSGASDLIYVSQVTRQCVVVGLWGFMTLFGGYDSSKLFVLDFFASSFIVRLSFLPRP